MLFENINQFKEAKNTLIETGGDTEKTFQILKVSENFSNYNDYELKLAINELNEGIGDKLMNFFSGVFGGDIAEIKNVLSQMKEQELKYNQEEFEIHKEFFKTLQAQKALDKDKNNANYQEMTKELASKRNSLNVRMKELNKTYDDVFNALEEKVKSIVGNNKRKKKFFNAQRANDVLVTKNDRYDKIKAITSDSTERSNELEDFFGVDPNSAKKDVEKAKAKAQAASEKISLGPSATSAVGGFNEKPEKTFAEQLEKIRNSVGGYFAKRKDLDLLIDDIEDLKSSHVYDSYSDEKKKNINTIMKSAGDLLNQLKTSR